jgi:hypothetical protein
VGLDHGSQPHRKRESLQCEALSLGWVSALERDGQTIWIVEARRDGKRYVVRADEILMAFLELEAAVRTCQWLAASPR